MDEQGNTPNLKPPVHILTYTVNGRFSGQMFWEVIPCHFTIIGK